MLRSSAPLVRPSAWLARLVRPRVMSLASSPAHLTGSPSSHLRSLSHTPASMASIVGQGARSPPPPFVSRTKAEKAAHAEHSSGCGCDGHDATAELETSSDEFVSDMKQAVAAAAAVDPSVQATGTATGHGGAKSNWSLSSMLSHNHRFVTESHYSPYLTDRYPYKKLVIVSCMDTRLTQLLPAALDLKNGDAKVIKVAGAMVAHPFGSVMRSILVAVYALGAEHILVIGHHDCGMTGMNPKRILDQAQARGIPASTFKTLHAAGLDLDSWLSGFESVESSVLHSVRTIQNHPLLNFDQHPATKAAPIEPIDGDTLPQEKSGNGSGNSSPSDSPQAAARRSLPKITVTGLVICPTTGRLDLVTPPASEEIAQLVERHRKEQEEHAKSKPQPKVDNTPH